MIRGASFGICLSRLALFVVGLVELDCEVARHAKMRGQPVTKVCNVVDEIDATSLQLGHCRCDIIAIERNVMGSRCLADHGLIGWMTPHIRFREVKDQPFFSDVREWEAEFVPEELTQRL